MDRGLAGGAGPRRRTRGALGVRALAHRGRDLQGRVPRRHRGLVGGGGDALKGGDGSDTVDGDAGGDTLSGGEGSDTVNGGEGNDRLKGGGNNDDVNGDAGRDELAGGHGNDHCIGGPDPDSITGCESGHP